ncbi:Maf family protein [Paenibacillus hodogayensis]
MSQQTTLLLASSSPRRRELIGTIGLPVLIEAPDVDETMPEGTPPDELVEQLSLRKAGTVAGRNGEQTGTIVIGSDTVVVLDGRILGKPADGDEAFAMLRALSGRTHQVYTGITCIDAGCTLPPTVAEGRGTVMPFGDVGRYRVSAEGADGKPRALVGHTVSRVTFRPMSDKEIRAYIRTGEPMDKAGAYGVQGSGALFIEKIEGDFYSVMGLPLSLLYQLLLHWGIRPFQG